VTTAAERLKQLSGLAGVSAAAMLLAIGTGPTAGSALVAYSQLTTATAAQHLLANVQTEPEESGGGGGLGSVSDSLDVRKKIQPAVEIVLQTQEVGSTIVAGRRTTTAVTKDWVSELSRIAGELPPAPSDIPALAAKVQDTNQLLHAPAISDVAAIATPLIDQITAVTADQASADKRRADEDALLMILLEIA